MNWISLDVRYPDDFEVVEFWHVIWKCTVTGSITEWQSEGRAVVTEKTLTTKWPIESFSYWKPLTEPPKQQ